MADSIASWPQRISVALRDPHQWLAEGLSREGPRWWLALLTVPLWLTPSRYAKHSSAVGAGRNALWAGAKLWFGTMTLLGLPLASLLQAPLTMLGRRLGYWDDTFNPVVIAMLMAAISFLIFVLLAAAAWVLIWTAYGIDALLGGQTILPPPFGYVASKMAGALAGIAVFTSALAFSIKPLNKPLWQWLDRGSFVQFVILIGIAAVFMIGSNRKTLTAQICDHQIYGSSGKAVAYRLGSIILMAGAMWILAICGSR